MSSRATRIPSSVVSAAAAATTEAASGSVAVVAEAERCRRRRSRRRSSLSAVDRIPAFRRSSLEILGRGGDDGEGGAGRSRKPRPLGRGSFCAVYAAESRVELPSSEATAVPAMPRRRYAIKCLRPELSKCGGTDADDSDERRRMICATKDLASEAEMLSSLGHPNIVSIAGIVRDDHSEASEDGEDSGGRGSDDECDLLTAVRLTGSQLRGGRSVAAYPLVLELLSETLDDRMAQWRRKSTAAATFTRSFKKALHSISKPGPSDTAAAATTRNPVLAEKLAAARQIASGMRYLHDVAGVVYRDLKPSNVGFDVRGIVKIFDFGLARKVPDAPANDRRQRSSSLEETYRMTACTGSLRYMAPEVALSRPYNVLSDVYSYGILLWEIFALRTPFQDLDCRDIYSVVVRGGHRPPVSAKWPRRVGQLMEHCWAKRMEERPDFRAVQRTLAREERGGGKGGGNNGGGLSCEKKRSSSTSSSTSNVYSRAKALGSLGNLTSETVRLSLRRSSTSTMATASTRRRSGPPPAA